LSAEIRGVARILRELRQASRSLQRLRAIDRCEEARSQLARLLDHPQLQSEEKVRIPSVLDDLNVVQAYVESGKRRDLDPEKKVRLDNWIAFFARIEGRLDNAALEISDG
jgi:hypothetical protein